MDQAFNLIVIGPLPDIGQYLATIERGVFNFMASPFYHETLTLAVRAAVADARQRRWAVPRVSSPQGA